jgi:hypothetical protein
MNSSCKRVIAAISVAAALLSGCAVQGEPYQRIAVPTQKGVIYVYRLPGFVGGGVAPNVTCGSIENGLGPGGYHPYVEDPGTITCSAHTEATSTVDVEVKPGQEYYLKEEIGMGFFIGRPHLSVVDPDFGHTEIQQCKQQ